ncbi:MAG: insulinase family protein [Ignavibacteria bacterium]|nr:insulinase family protein [Ignavibacteria bacterium]
MYLKNSAYEFPVIGFEEDINSFTVKEALEFHENYYSPENSVLILTGDIDINHSKKLISKYFADIKKTNKFQRTGSQIAGIKENKRIEIYDNIKLPMLCIAYQLPKAGSPEEYQWNISQR